MNAIDCFKIVQNVCIYNDTNGIYYSIMGLKKNSLVKRNDSQMKITQNIQLEDNSEPFNGLLEGIPITAALNWTQSGKETLYLFAGRHLCRQEISFDWVPMCNITDISDLVIDCFHEDGDKTSVSPQNKTHYGTDIYPYETDYTLIVIISIVTLILLIVALVLVVVYIRRNKDKEKEEPTLRFIDNKSTKHLHSDIPSPKPKTDESDDSFAVKTKSSNTPNKKMNTKKSQTTLTDM